MNAFAQWGSKCTNHSLPSWYKWCRVTSRPHRLMKTSSKRSKRRDLYLKVTTSWDKLWYTYCYCITTMNNNNLFLDRKQDVLLPQSGKAVARVHLDGWVGSLWFIFRPPYVSFLFYATHGLDIKEGLERSGPRQNYTRDEIIGFVGQTWTRVVWGMKEVCIVHGCPKPELVILLNSLPVIVPIDPYERKSYDKRLNLASFSK